MTVVAARDAASSLRSVVLGALFVAGFGGLPAMAQMPFGMGPQPHQAAVGNPTRGANIAKAKCAPCHGKNGNGGSPEMPKLAGQNPAYLYWQLWAFKTGTRQSDIMSGIVPTLTDADMADTASYYADQPARPNTVHDKGLAAAGEQIFYAGTDYGRAPACMACHGGGGRAMPMMGMMGRGMMGSRMMSTIPNLNGQHAPYTIDQLRRFAVGARPSLVMSRIAVAMSPLDWKAVAEYLSGLR